MLGFLASLAIPAPIRRFLPHVMIVLAVVLVLGGLVLWIDHKGYQRATDDRNAADNKMMVWIGEQLRAYEGRAVDRENKRAADTNSKLDHISKVAQGSQTKIIKELSHEVRYTDPALGYPAGVRDSLNETLASSTCARTDDGGIVCTVRKADPAADARSDGDGHQGQ